MRFQEMTVALDAVDAADPTYRISTDLSLDALVDSIKTLGLMSAPWLIPTESRRYAVVSGFRRLEACRLVGRTEIRARVLDIGVEAKTCVEIAVSDNALQRPLNLIEKSRSINLLSGVYPLQDHLVKRAVSLGLAGNLSQLEKLRQVAGLTDSIQTHMLAGSLSLPMALELGRYEDDFAGFLGDLFHDLQLSLNKQREWITMIREIARREGLAEAAVLQDGGLQSILRTPDLDRNQKAQRARIYLKKWRYPAISRAERTFETHLSKLKLGSHVKLTPPKYFEGTTFCLTLQFTSLEDLIARRATLDNLIQHPSLAKILG